MRARGQGLVAIAIVGAVVAAGFALDRAVGIREPAPVPVDRPRVPSGAWLCPHGGGEGWRSSLYLANPGEAPVEARVTTMDRRGSSPPRDLEVPAGSTIRVDVRGSGPESAAFVEHFGGWIAAGWVTADEDPELPGAAAEPCAPGGGTDWVLADGAAEEGQVDDVVIANPFGADAVVDLVLLAKDRPPIRDSALTSVVVRAGRSRAIRLNPFIAGERAVGAIVTARVGRVAVASVVQTQGAGFRMLLGQSAADTELVFPVAAGTGQTELAVVRTADTPATFGATLLSRATTRPAGDLVEQVVDAGSVDAFPVIANGPSAVHVAARDDATLAGALRAEGPHDGAAVGWADPAPGWVVLPTVAGAPAAPGLVLVNAGGEDASITLRTLPIEGVPTEITLTLSAGRVASAPASFLEAAPDAAVLVTSDVGVIAAGASTSLGKLGSAAYAVALGVPVP